MSRFWKAYASVNDDIRHELIERAWFGRKVTSDIDHNDMPGIGEEPKSGSPSVAPGDFYGTSRTENPSVSRFYSTAVEASGEGPEDRRPSRESFYGTPAEDAAPEARQGPAPEL